MYVEVCDCGVGDGMRALSLVPEVRKCCTEAHFDTVRPARSDEPPAADSKGRATVEDKGALREDHGVTNRVVRKRARFFGKKDGVDPPGHGPAVGKRLLAQHRQWRMPKGLVARCREQKQERKQKAHAS
jgi:hypothetical protein